MRDYSHYKVQYREKPKSELQKSIEKFKQLAFEFWPTEPEVQRTHQRKDKRIFF